MVKSFAKPVKIFFLRNRKFYRTFKLGFGFYPDDYKLYQIALTHRSASTFINDTSINNERLEYLGDAILDAVIADFLFREYPEEKEGFLTQMRSKIVNREFLNALALKFGINKFLISHMPSSYNGKNLYGNALEAFIGAMYLDKGYVFSQKYIINSLLRKFVDINQLKEINTNYKSQLLELVQKSKKDIDIDTDADPINTDMFLSYIRMDNNIIGSGYGKTKKEAEQMAAGQALLKLI